MSNLKITLDMIPDEIILDFGRRYLKERWDEVEKNIYREIETEKQRKQSKITINKQND